MPSPSSRTSEPKVAPALMRRQEAADYLSVSSMTVERMRREGAFPAVLVGQGAVRYRKADLDAYLDDPARELEAAGRLKAHPEGAAR